MITELQQRGTATGVALAAAASIWVGAAAGSTRPSRPDFVSRACGAAANARACAVALRYLAALDLDRTREACALLEPGTLEAAGGIAGCMRTLASARGIRIRYAILGVHASPLGRTVDFSTTAQSRTAIRQAMIVTPRGRILAIAPVL